MRACAASLGAGERERFVREGFVLRRGVFGNDELASMTEHYRGLRSRGRIEGCFEVEEGDDPARVWPRMMHPHRVDAFSMRLLLDGRMLGLAAELLGEPALTLQSMWYWKAPGTRGQALHQDEFYVRTSGAHCLAAWLSVDDTDDDNGCLRVVPGSHATELQCPHAADPAVSFSRHEVCIPPGLEVVAVEMAAGDVLYFHGCLIHGSMPNRTTDRWRRTFIGHFLPTSAAGCARGFHPLYDAAGREVEIADSGPETDPCGGPGF